MKRFILTLMLLTASTCSSTPVVFGIELGKTTSSEARELFQVEDRGISSVSGLHMYYSPNPQRLAADGVCFIEWSSNSDDIIETVDVGFLRQRYEELRSILRSKYSSGKHELNDIGGQTAVFLFDGGAISLETVHLSPYAIILYKTTRYEDIITSRISKLNKEKTNRLSTGL